MYQVRADYDARTIVVYQAYRAAIAVPAIREQRFVAPFSFQRMTWIKPSYRWLMHRSNWGRKHGQEYILAVRITRDGWEEALSRGVLTTGDGLESGAVHIQWDPERSVRGAALNEYSIQVGIGRDLIRTFVHQWIVEITDFSERTRKIAALIQTGQTAKAQKLLPPERLYPMRASEVITPRR